MRALHQDGAPAGKPGKGLKHLARCVHARHGDAGSALGHCQGVFALKKYGLGRGCGDGRAKLPVRFHCAGAKLLHVAQHQHQSFLSRQQARGLDAAAHGQRVGVVGVVHHTPAPGLGAAEALVRQVRSCQAGGDAFGVESQHVAGADNGSGVLGEVRAAGGQFLVEKPSTSGSRAWASAQSSG
jgi:hypothetical protein